MGYYLNSGDAFELYGRETNKPYLNYHDGYVRIPNKELQIEFDKIIKTAPRFHYMRELEKESARISTTE